MRTLFEVKRQGGGFVVLAHELIKVDQSHYQVNVPPGSGREPRMLHIPRSRRGLGTTRKAAIDNYADHCRERIAEEEREIAELRDRLTAVEVLRKVR